MPAENPISNCTGEGSSPDCREIPTLVPGASPLPCPSPTLRVTGLFLTLVLPHSSPPLWHLTFLKYAFIEALPAWLRDSAVPCCGAGRTGWNRLCPALASPHRGCPAARHCQHLTTDTWYKCELGTFLGTFLIPNSKILPRAKWNL